MQVLRDLNTKIHKNLATGIEPGQSDQVYRLAWLYSGGKG
jgi:hypothetical protein